MESAVSILARTPEARSHGARCPCCGKPLPSVRGDRRFNLIDAMILVAASAVAFAIVRPIVDGALSRDSAWLRYLAWVIGGLTAWTPAVLVLRLRSPRPELRRLSRQPGFAASVAGTAVLALGLVAFGLIALVRVARQSLAVHAGIPFVSPEPAWWLGVVLHFGAVVGPAVIAAWLVLALSGRRRPSPGWLDVLGRALGILWIALFVINCCARLAYLRG